jgi:hypothetical protein
VQHVADRVPRDGVEREVATSQVVVDFPRELDDGVPAERLDVATERRDLVHDTVGRQHADRAVLDADGHRAAEDAAHLLGSRARRQVPVVREAAEECVANRAAHGPDIMSGGVQPAGDVDDCGRWLQLHGQPQSTEPPFTFITSPVMCRASGEQRNTTGPATSSGVATRPRGCRPRCGGDLAGIRLRRHLGVDPAGRHAVDRDVVRGQLDADALHERAERTLRHGVVGVTRLATLAGRRADEHDAAVVRHDARGLAGAVEDGVEVGGQRTAPLVRRHERDGHVRRRPDPGVADEDVQATELVEDAVEKPLRFPRFGEVAGVAPGGDPLALQLGDQATRLVVTFAVGNPDVRARLRQHERDGAAHAARAARDEGTLAEQVQAQHGSDPVRASLPGVVDIFMCRILMRPSTCRPAIPRGDAPPR